MLLARHQSVVARVLAAGDWFPPVNGLRPAAWLHAPAGGS